MPESSQGRARAGEVYPVDSGVGGRAGQLLGRVGAESEPAVDASAVAVAGLADGAIV